MVRSREVELSELVKAVLLFALLIPVAWIDWKTKRVPNRWTITFALAGLLASAVLSGPRGLLSSVLAMAAGLVLGFMLFTFGVIGGGDGKLMGAIGSIGGMRFFAEALAWTLLIGLVVSILVLAWKKALFPLLRRLIKAGWEAIRWQLEPSEAIVEGEGHRIPFAIVIGTGSVAALIAETAGLRLFAGF